MVGRCGWRGHKRGSLLALLLLVLVGAWVADANAIPAFSRKYQTSCLTCHTVYPKLNPFGEAFRRDGYRFPGIDSDAVRQGTVPLGQPAYRQLFPKVVWPSSLPADVPLAMGFDGQTVAHPDRDSGAGRADHRASFSMANTIAEGHLWAGGSFDDKTTFYSEISVSDTAELEHAQVLFNDLIGPKHALNLAVGRMPATLSSFGPHSSYLADLATTPLFLSALYGTLDPSWGLGGSYNSFELTSLVRGRFDASAGIAAGANDAVRLTNNYYGHIGCKLGGIRLDGENWAGPSNPEKPWAERALTLDAFIYWTRSHFNVPTGVAAAPLALQNDRVLTYGGSLRGQWGSLEIDGGLYQERHDHVLADGGHVRALVQYDEASYVVFPWLVPAVRFEYLRLSPEGGPVIHDIRIIPGIALLVRANLKLTLLGQLEQARGVPPAGWGPANGFAAPAAGTSVTELEMLAADLAFAF